LIQSNLSEIALSFVYLIMSLKCGNLRKYGKNTCFPIILYENVFLLREI